MKKDELINHKNETPLNNGGRTSYYDLPRPRVDPLRELIETTLTTISDSEVDRLIIKLYEIFPATLNDLIEYKNMKPWQHECFKALYAMDERATRSTDGSSSLEREFNKIQYYLERGKNLSKN